MALLNGIDASRKWFKSWSESAQSFLLAAIGLMTFFGLTVHDVWPTKGIFWIFCAPTTLWILIRQQGYLDLWRSKPMRWAFGILLLYLISVYWSEPTTGYYQGKIQRHTLQTWLFVVALFFAFKSSTFHKVQFARLLILSCGISALTAFIVFYQEHSFAERLIGHSHLLYWSSVGPAVMLGCLITSGLLMYEQKSSSNVLWLMAGFFVVGFFVFMSQARTPLISFACLSFFWGWFYFGIRKTCGVLTALIVVSVIIVLVNSSLHDSWNRHISTGLSGRDVIWKYVLQGFFSKPWFGHGAASIFTESVSGKAISDSLGRVIYHPHGLLFSVLFYFGLTGLVVWLGYLASFSKMLVNKDIKWFAMSALFCLILLVATDFYKLVSEMGIHWWFWWLPTIAFISVAGAEKTE